MVNPAESSTLKSLSPEAPVASSSPYSNMAQAARLMAMRHAQRQTKVSDKMRNTTQAGSKDPLQNEMSAVVMADAALKQAACRVSLHASLVSAPQGSSQDGPMEAVHTQRPAKGILPGFQLEAEMQHVPNASNSGPQCGSSDDPCEPRGSRQGRKSLSQQGDTHHKKEREECPTQERERHKLQRAEMMLEEEKATSSSSVIEARRSADAKAAAGHAKAKAKAAHLAAERAAAKALAQRQSDALRQAEDDALEEDQKRLQALQAKEASKVRRAQATARPEVERNMREKTKKAQAEEEMMAAAEAEAQRLAASKSLMLERLRQKGERSKKRASALSVVQHHLGAKEVQRGANEAQQRQSGGNEGTQEHKIATLNGHSGTDSVQKEREKLMKAVERHKAAGNRGGIATTTSESDEEASSTHLCSSNDEDLATLNQALFEAQSSLLSAPRKKRRLLKGEVERLDALIQTRRNRENSAHSDTSEDESLSRSISKMSQNANCFEVPEAPSGPPPPVVISQRRLQRAFERTPPACQDASRVQELLQEAEEAYREAGAAANEVKEVSEHICHDDASVSHRPRLLEPGTEQGGKESMRDWKRRHWEEINAAMNLKKEKELLDHQRREAEAEAVAANRRALEEARREAETLKQALVEAEKEKRKIEREKQDIAEQAEREIMAVREAKKLQAEAESERQRMALMVAEVARLATLEKEKELAWIEAERKKKEAAEEEERKRCEAEAQQMITADLQSKSESVSESESESEEVSAVSAMVSAIGVAHGSPVGDEGSKSEMEAEQKTAISRLLEIKRLQKEVSEGKKAVSSPPSAPKSTPSRQDHQDRALQTTQPSRLEMELLQAQRIAQEETARRMLAEKETESLKQIQAANEAAEAEKCRRLKAEREMEEWRSAMEHEKESKVALTIALEHEKLATEKAKQDAILLETKRLVELEAREAREAVLQQALREADREARQQQEAIEKIQKEAAALDDAAAASQKPFDQLDEVPESPEEVESPWRRSARHMESLSSPSMIDPGQEEQKRWAEAEAELRLERRVREMSNNSKKAKEKAAMEAAATREMEAAAEAAREEREAREVERKEAEAREAELIALKLHKQALEVEREEASKAAADAEAQRAAAEEKQRQLEDELRAERRAAEEARKAEEKERELERERIRQEAVHATRREEQKKLAKEKMKKKQAELKLKAAEAEASKVGREEASKRLRANDEECRHARVANEMHEATEAIIHTGEMIRERRASISRQHALEVGRHKQRAEVEAKKKEARVQEMKRQAAEAAAEMEAAEKDMIEALTDPCGWISRIQLATTHYNVLDLPHQCESATVRTRYLQLARLLHPDKCTEDAATEAFQKVLLHQAQLPIPVSFLSDMSFPPSYTGPISLQDPQRSIDSPAV